MSALASSPVKAKENALQDWQRAAKLQLRRRPDSGCATTMKRLLHLPRISREDGRHSIGPYVKAEPLNHRKKTSSVATSANKLFVDARPFVGL
jgi:hypothetical protein